MSSVIKFDPIRTSLILKTYVLVDTEVRVSIVANVQHPIERKLMRLFGNSPVLMMYDAIVEEFDGTPR